MNESLPLRFLYRTAPGRGVLKLLIHPGLSRLAGWFLSTGISRLAIPYFIRKNHISLDGIAVPSRGFSSFNDFFSRKYAKSPGFDLTPRHLCSPCDGLLSCFPIGGDSRFVVKHSVYSLYDLLDSRTLADSFQGGTALIFRLTPTHYHRYHFVDDGVIVNRRTIPGVLHCVRPIAAEQFPVFIQNSREYAVLETTHFGTMVQMEVGALMVGKICNDPHPPRCFRGEEKGHFAFGGSTIILLFQKDQIALTDEILAALQEQEEYPVTLGQWIATRP